MQSRQYLSFESDWSEASALQHRLHVMARTIAYKLTTDTSDHSTSQLAQKSLQTVPARSHTFDGLPSPWVKQAHLL